MLVKTLFVLPLLVSLLLITDCSSTKEPSPNIVCEDYIGEPQEVASIKGGVQALYKNLRFPESMKGSQNEGEVFAVYFINASGDVDKVVIQSATSLAFANEVMRVSRSLRFNPAKNNGTPVCSNFAIPVRFRDR